MNQNIALWFICCPYVTVSLTCVFCSPIHGLHTFYTCAHFFRPIEYTNAAEVFLYSCKMPLHHNSPQLHASSQFLSRALPCAFLTESNLHMVQECAER